MIPYKNEFAFEKVFRSGPSVERTVLKVYTGNDISENEAKSLWGRIADHKWYVSETLSRDVGFHVAAVDYIENFYAENEEPRTETKLSSAWKWLSKRTHSAARNYLEAKGTTLPL